MAKLSAHGVERRRLERVVPIPEHEGVTNKVVYSFRSDGHVMRKVVSTFPSRYRPSGYQRVDHGWKLWKRVAKGADVAKVQDLLAERLIAKGAREV